jgi:single-stranded DNA-binding protein
MSGECPNKGRHACRLQTRKWKGPEGEKRPVIEAEANQIQLLDRAAKNGKVAKAAEPSKADRPAGQLTMWTNCLG